MSGVLRPWPKWPRPRAGPDHTHSSTKVAQNPQVKKYKNKNTEKIQSNILNH